MTTAQMIDAASLAADAFSAILATSPAGSYAIGARSRGEDRTGYFARATDFRATLYSLDGGWMVRMTEIGVAIGDDYATTEQVISLAADLLATRLPAGTSLVTAKDLS